MHVYFSGIGGVGISSLARIAMDLGYKVSGSDRRVSVVTNGLTNDGFNIYIGTDDAGISKRHEEEPIDWFVHTAALPADHPELAFAYAHGIKTTKRDDFIKAFTQGSGLQMIAVAGTHGKTTTTGMMAWLFHRLNIPVSYSVGSTLPFGHNGKYDKESKYFVYEADEFDQNFLQYHPKASALVAVDYDHPDTYATPEDYKKAFRQFAEQSEHVITWHDVAEYVGLEQSDKIEIIQSFFGEDELKNTFSLPGHHNRQNAFLAKQLMNYIFPDLDQNSITLALNDFPGTGRRMEKIATNLYSDYAHHPVEIHATISAAKEVNDNVIVVYQPHQNVRQHEIADHYRDCFAGAEKVYWLPTYLSREDRSLGILTPEQLYSRLSDPSIATEVQMDNTLKGILQKHLDEGKLVLALSAGDLDEWIRTVPKRSEIE